MNNVIEVKDLNKIFVNGKQESHILKNINLTVKQGEFVSIMGPSGSGKSTLLYLLGGLDQPTTGSVMINGTDLSTLNDKKLSSMRNEEIGFVFQNYALFRYKTVYENIAFGQS